MTRTPRRLLTTGLLVAASAGLAGCTSSSTAPTTTTTSRPPSTSSAPTTPPPTSSTTSSTARTTTTTAPPTVLPLATATTNGAFLSPSKNLACLIAQNPANQVRCASFSPPLLVTMTPDGTRTTCQGGSCQLGNPAAGTRVLPYGSATGDGIFTCVSALAGITCTVASGTGFVISRSGITDVGN